MSHTRDKADVCIKTGIFKDKKCRSPGVLKEIAFRTAIDPKAHALVQIDIKTHKEEKYSGKSHSSAVDYNQHKAAPTQPDRYRLFNYRGVFVGYGPTPEPKHGTAGNGKRCKP